MPTFHEFLRTHYAWFTKTTQSSGFSHEDVLNDVAAQLAEIGGDLSIERWQSLTQTVLQEVRKKHSREFWDRKKQQSIGFVTDEGKVVDSIAEARAAQEAFEADEEKRESQKGAFATTLLTYLNNVSDEKERLALLLLYHNYLSDAVKVGLDASINLRQSAEGMRSRRARLAALERADRLQQQAEDLYEDLQTASRVAERSRLDVSKPRNLARLLGIDGARLDTYRRRFEQAARTKAER